MATIRRAWVLLLAAIALLGSSMAAVATTYKYIGEKGAAWPTAWTPMPHANDGVDSGLIREIDLVGGENDPRAYWADGGDYVYFRMRQGIDDFGADPTPTIQEPHFVLIDVVDKKWDSTG